MVRMIPRIAWLWSTSLHEVLIRSCMGSQCAWFMALLDMLFPTSTFILADVVSGSRHALFYRQDGGRGGGTPIDGLSTWFAPSIIISIGSPPQTVLASLDLVYGLTRVAQGALNTDKSSTFRSTGNVTVMKSQTSSEEVTVSTATDHLAVGDWNVNSALLCESFLSARNSH